MDSDHKMTKSEWKSFNYQKKLDKVYEDNRFYCLCGHSVAILPNEKRVLCTHCGHWVYRDKKEMFKERLRGKLNAI